MTAGLKILSLAEALADHATTRQALIARNIAHADTPGWRAQDLSPFSKTWMAEEAAGDSLALRPAATRPGHVAFGPEDGAEAVFDAAEGAESPNGNTVSLEDQMVRSADLRLQHDLAMGVWKTSLDILRASLGRPR